MVLPIAKHPNKILRIPGEDVVFPLSTEVKRLVNNMIDTVRNASGIGLAAPQVKQSLNIIIINLEYLNVPIFAVVNPKIEKASKTEIEMEEGCLSIPNVFGMVLRPEKVTFSGYDVAGKHFKVQCDGLLARVVQHEIDHTKGILIIDKIDRYTQGENLIKEKGF